MVKADRSFVLGLCLNVGFVLSPVTKATHPSMFIPYSYRAD
jgi:hypothetical protein